MGPEPELIGDIKAFELSLNKGLAIIKDSDELIGGIQTKNDSFFHVNERTELF